MKGLLNPGSLKELPTVASWLSHAEATSAVVKDNYADLSEEEQLNVAIQENVLSQLEHLRTLPSVASKLIKGELKLHGWVYKFETGEVFAYDPVQEQFLPLKDPVTSKVNRELLSSAL